MSLIQPDTDMSSSPPELKAVRTKTSGQISMTAKTAAIDCQKLGRLDNAQPTLIVSVLFWLGCAARAH